MVKMVCDLLDVGFCRIFHTLKKTSISQGKHPKGVPPQVFDP